MHIVSHRTVAQVRLARVIPSMHVHLCVALWLFLFTPSPFPLRSVALLPALPDVFLRVPREVEVQTPVRLPLGDRGHFLTTRHPSQINEENIDSQHSRITTFNSEAITWRQRSKLDSEDREPPSSTSTSK